MIPRVLIPIVVIAAVWLGWQWLFPSDEAQIEAVLHRMADGIEAPDGGDTGGGGGEVGRLARAASLRNEFAPDVTVDAGPPFQQIRGRDALVGAAARINSAARNIEIRFPDVSILVADDRQSATAMVTAEARFDEPGGGRGIDAREFELAFTRLEGRWVISAVTFAPALQPLR